VVAVDGTDQNAGFFLGKRPACKRTSKDSLLSSETRIVMTAIAWFVYSQSRWKAHILWKQKKGIPDT